MLSRFKISKRFQDGFTGVDVLLSLVLSSFMFLGMSYIFIDITEILKVEEIHSDVLKYGNTILNVIEKDMVQATKVDCKELKITCTKDGDSTVYSIDDVNGILKDGIPFHTVIGSAIRFDNVNSAGQFLYKISNFEFDPVGGTDCKENNPKYECSVFDVKIYVDIYSTDNDPDDDPVDKVFFNRRIYAVNNYLRTAI